MKTYTVKEIANMMSTNPETVRRWIRSGKLNATQISRKTGNVVSEKDLKKFIAEGEKYVDAIIGSSAFSDAIFRHSVEKKIKAQLDENYIDTVVGDKEMIAYLKKEIERKEMSIKQRSRMIKKFNEEITQLEKEIADSKKIIDALGGRHE